MPKEEVMSGFGKKERVTFSGRNPITLFAPLIMFFILALSISFAEAEPIPVQQSNPESVPAPAPEIVRPPMTRPVTRGYKKGEIVVKYKDNIDKTTIKGVNSRMKVKVKRKLPMSRNMYLLTLPEGMKVSEAVNKFRKILEVEYARPNYEYGKNRGRRAR